MKKQKYLTIRRKQCVAVSKKSKAENLVAEHLDACGISYRRQARFGSCIIDFYVWSHCIGIEVDGPEHRKDNDGRRDSYLLNKHRVRILRVRNYNIDDILEAIKIIKESINFYAERGKSFDNYVSSPDVPF
jgi:very-short-patch-repair endonuclease